jgi:hypothetical protein
VEWLKVWALSSLSPSTERKEKKKKRKRQGMRKGPVMGERREHSTYKALTQALEIIFLLLIGYLWVTV